MISIAESEYANAVRRLREAGIPFPAAEARRLMRCLGNGKTRCLDFENAVAARARRVPFSHITGERAFWNSDFEVTSAVLDPRPDSETLIRATLRELADKRWRPVRVLDLGTGSGCLLISILEELPQATGLGIDNDREALEVANRNAMRIGVSDRSAFCFGNWAEGLAECFDIILCNPPYVPTEAFGTLEPEVALAEPRRALDGGTDGLDAYREILPDIRGVLRDDGLACFEIDPDRFAEVRKILWRNGLKSTSVYADLAGRTRCLVGR